ncbi:MAG: precorrin-6y C5,15-methyltransferase (decarboxylating) subunit CbiE [Deltaproteobacteria bacterium]|nr:precorrin-6y C5,15-methyltransferase (decarboxylating) subunit CbiE [Deltaproteobacteria bacterium]MBZ0219598.1 precorrin-6y C5,15-methyltransferase (decarboxylating) subunit CbiE [Deltaproteobacteria bacterium]
MIHIIGIGIQGRESLLPEALGAIEKAGLLVGGKRHLSEFLELPAAKVQLGGLEEAASAIEKYLARKERRPVAVLATGDPLIFGIGSFIIRRFGKRRVRVLPNVSAIQEAFSRIKEDMNGVKILSVHGREADYALLSKEAASNAKLALFTDGVNTPARICRELKERGIGGRAFVCESLGEDERITEGTLESISKRRSFAPLNILILMRDRESIIRETGFGIPDRLFSHSGGMITKEEFRVVSLSRLGLTEGNVVWDIGACSGSVAIEAARLTGGKVFAIERDRKRVSDIRENKNRFGCGNLDVIEGEAPGALKGLPAPDAVFVGGGGKGIKMILSYTAGRLKPGGRVVVNAVTIETASAAFEFFGKKGWEKELIQMSISKARPAGDLNMLAAYNPVFIISGKKP